MHPRTMGTSTLALSLPLLLAGAPASGQVWTGDDAPLYRSIDENLQPVDMADMIDGRPLVLAIGSAS
jgi:hypothetical protein